MVTVIIPALNEEKTIAQVVAIAGNDERVTEVIVVDDCSTDQTVQQALQAGASVISSGKIGKGDSMKDGLAAARNEIIAFLDADITTYPQNIIHLLTAPILREEADFVKSCFSRQAGRVTELVAKPLLSLFYPFFPDFKQPLSGMIAGKKQFLKQCEFEEGYGVDIGVLIDMYRFGARIVEVSIGAIENRMHPLEKLGKMSREVSRTILKKAGILSARSETDSPASQSWAAISPALGVQRLCVFDMDYTLLRCSFIETAARQWEWEPALDAIRDHVKDPVLRTKKIARLLKGVSQQDLQELVGRLPITPSLSALVNRLREQGFHLALISDSYDAVAGIFRQQFGFDFILAQELEFVHHKATGEVKVPSFFMNDNFSACTHSYCKSHALLALCHRLAINPKSVVVIGDGANDRCMFDVAGRSIAFCPTDPGLPAHADFHVSEPDFSLITDEMIIPAK